MHISEVMDENARSRRKPKLVLHAVEIRPATDKHGKPQKDGGHVVRTVYRGADGDYRESHAEKPFGAGEHEKMLAHVANELKLPEPKDEEERDGDGSDDEEDSAAGAAY